jgi:hypothetical protein
MANEYLPQPRTREVDYEMDPKATRAMGRERDSPSDARLEEQMVGDVTWAVITVATGIILATIVYIYMNAYSG